MSRLFGFIFLPWIWIIPALAATIIFPIWAQNFRTIKKPNEAAYVAMALTLLPKGLLGLLVCAIFAGTLTTLCSYLNVASGVFVRNFYIRVVNKDASEIEADIRRAIRDLPKRHCLGVACLLF